ncbi:Transthyretin-like family protein [Dictyocaulus viviparus]|uniref:Transthyretin-like family protein n=1 Tax=Dictyocaulus viviparus TaxID=29172 RepID=A0A0D8XT82_DICVI|nr:Transthyretin-like family protein [Dictyocaulus viviparus]
MFFSCSYKYIMKFHSIPLLLIGLFAVPDVFGFFGREQTVGIAGHLTCNHAPASNVTLKLYDEDIIKDSLLSQEELNDGGSFQMLGHKREFSGIEPYLEITHHCGVKRGCQKKETIGIPERFVEKGHKIKSFYDIGTIDLNRSTKSFTIDCPHD